MINTQNIQFLRGRLEPIRNTKLLGTLTIGRIYEFHTDFEHIDRSLGSEVPWWMKLKQMTHENMDIFEFKLFRSGMEHLIQKIYSFKFVWNNDQNEEQGLESQISFISSSTLYQF